ncbi:MAG: glutamate-cysteine ligase family protein [Planctomycetota bacterium]
MSRRLLVVVSRREDVAGYDGPLVTADDFLAGEGAGVQDAGRLVVNLCRSWRYLSKGYYVSLLAEARGQEVVPSPGAILGVQNPRRLFRALEEAGVETIDHRGRRLPPAIAPAAERPGEGPRLLVRDWVDGAVSYRPAEAAETAEVTVILGRAGDPSFRRLAAAVYRAWPFPLLGLRLVREEGRWKVVELTPLKVHHLDKEQRRRLVEELDRGLKARGGPAPAMRASLAVLVDDDPSHRPSSLETLERLERVGGKKGVLVQRLGLRDLARVSDFDALFIRAHTGPDLASFAFALQAEGLGMPVIDDTASILRCCNKVFLHELLRREGLATPTTRVVSRQTDFAELQRELGLPVVLKLPDGSFSAAVYKVTSADDYRARAEELFARSPLLLAQAYVPTPFDWRITTLGGKLLFACRYHMAKGHWQIARPTRAGRRFGRVEAVALTDVPQDVRELALAAANLIGSGFYGVDLKETPKGPVVIEVNDNPNLDLGYEDAVAGDHVYEELIDWFLSRIEEGFRPRAASNGQPPADMIASWRTPVLAAPEARAEPPYAPFEVCGIELEYPVVDRDLNVVHKVEDALAALAGRRTSDVELGVLGVCNEIADHVLELRNDEPLKSLVELERVLHEGVRRLSELLAERFQARLLPTGMHPWFDPRRARLWTRSGRRIYGTYERLFDTRTHGWVNVQASHVNLPLGAEPDAVALLNGCGFLVPYLPAIAASSPLVEGELGEAVDNRVAYLLTHQERIPETLGDLVPEFIDSLHGYRRDVLRPMYKALDRFPGASALRREFLNARGAVIKASRASLEVRILDVQECVHMDVALGAFVRWTLAALSEELKSGSLALPDHGRLVEDLQATVAKGSEARVWAPFAAAQRDEEGKVPVRAVLRDFLARARTTCPPAERHYLDRVETTIEEGSLSERIAAALPRGADEDAFTEAARRIYIQLADCLLENRPWEGRALT